MRVLYAVDFKSWLCNLMFLFRNNTVWLAFLVMLWISQLRSSDMVTPSYLAADTRSNSVLWRKYLEGIGVFNLVTCNTWYFEGLKFMFQASSHLSSLQRSSCLLHIFSWCKGTWQCHLLLTLNAQVGHLCMQGIRSVLEFKTKLDKLWENSRYDLSEIY